MPFIRSFTCSRPAGVREAGAERHGTPRNLSAGTRTIPRIYLDAQSKRAIFDRERLIRDISCSIWITWNIFETFFVLNSNSTSQDEANEIKVMPLGATLNKSNFGTFLYIIEHFEHFSNILHCHFRTVIVKTCRLKKNHPGKYNINKCIPQATGFALPTRWYELPTVKIVISKVFNGHFEINSF